MIIGFTAASRYLRYYNLKFLGPEFLTIIVRTAWIKYLAFFQNEHT